MHPIRTLCALLLLSIAAAAETVVVRQVGFYFSPREVVIEPGDTVRWQWGGGTHTVTEGTDGSFNGNELFHGPLNQSNQVFSFTFTPQFLAAHPMPNGRYDYFCAPHFSIGMTGVVHVAEPPPGTSLCSGDGTGTACPCGNTPPPGVVGCLNSSFLAGRLRGIGTASLAADTLRLSFSGAPEGASVRFFQGASVEANGAGVVFGDGLRCAGRPLVRLGTASVSFGWARYPDPTVPQMPVSVAGLVPPGSTRLYQAWYFDSPGACGAPTSNWSNAVRIVWQ